MFDIGFWELGVIGMVALMVIGPERLPAVARTAGLWVGRVRRMATGFREDLNRNSERMN
ncbi:MAG: twin-arginine translocase subunit TatB [Immundisolibacteraceae bacterium]|nr:twin-arginine translocase subunit TatB [Immundisolibacteraceae bacterium]